MTEKNDAPSYVEYSANNSGGHWWLTDEDWYKLEKAGWVILWAKDEFVYDDGAYVYENGAPKISGGSRTNFIDNDGRWLGTLAKYAFKPNCEDIKAAVSEWEDITRQSASEPGCQCCGQPHNFALYKNGKYAGSGPSISWEPRSSWE